MVTNTKLELPFQPVYYPSVNQIERRWETMHDIVTRNQRCATFYELCEEVKRIFEVVQPFPGANHGAAKFGSAI